MSHAALSALIAHCRALYLRQPQLPDAELLRRFALKRDAAAFEQLLNRYAPLVWGVCRRILPEDADREDAFQAVFLALVRQAGSLDARQSLAGWLHTVARRAAHRVRSRRPRTGALPERTTMGDVAEEASRRELFRAVDEEIARLPAALRMPMILCCLEGRTRDEAAAALGCSVAAIKRRLERGRDRLRRRLERRGLTLPAAFLVIGLTGERIGPALWTKTMRSALGSPSSAVSVLAAQAGLPALAIGKAKLVLLGLIAVLTAGTVGMIGYAWTTNALPESAASPTQAKSTEAPTPGMDRHGDPLPEGALARLGTVRFRHGAMIDSVAFSPDGKMLAAGGAGRTISLWDSATGKELPRFPPFDRGQPARVAFSPDGKVLASVSTANSLVCLYDVATGKELRLLQGHQSAVTCLAFSPNGKFLASAEHKGTIRIWNPNARNPAPRPPGNPNEELRHITGDWGEVHALAFSPDGKWLAFAGADGKVRLWNARSGDEMRRLDGPPQAIYSLSFSPDGKFLASAGAAKTIRLWAAATGEPIRSLGDKLDPVLAATFSPDSRLLASAHRDGTLALWDPRTGRNIRHWRGHAFAAASVAFSPDGKRLASGGAWGSAVRLWDVATGAELQASDAHRAAIDLVRWMSDGNVLVSIDHESRILWWDLSTQRPRRQVVRPAPSWSVFALSANGETLATGGFPDCGVRLGPIASDKPSRLLGKHKQLIQAIALSPDGRLIAAGGRDEAIRLWDAETGKQIHPFEGPGQVAGGLAFSPDGKTLAYGTAKLGDAAGKIQLVDTATGRELRAFNNQGWVRVLVFSPDGKVLASWHNDYRDEPFVRLWDVATGEELCRHNGHPGGNGTIAFSPDGKLVASGEDGWDNGHTARAATAIHLWEAATGRLVRRFAGHHSGVRSLSLSPDGLKLASGGGDSTILVWDITGHRADGRWHKKPLTPRELDACWQALADADAAKAYEAVWTFAAAAEQAAPFLQTHLHPVPRPDAKTVARLLADLDSDQFAVRQKANVELSKFGDAITPELRQALASKPPLEARRRVQQLLDRASESSAERLRDRRAIQVLEYIHTPPARPILAALAAGAPAARRTEEAKAALQRWVR